VPVGCARDGAARGAAVAAGAVAGDGTTRLAHAELIERECLAAEVLDMRHPVPEWLAGRPGWSAGIVATFNWVWRGTAGPPVEVPRTAAG